MEKIFIAFGGRKEQNKDLDKINKKDNLILLNLEKFNKKELNKYLIEQKISLPYPQIPKEISYDDKTIPSWGIIYEFEDEEYYSFIFILELYLNNFLKPLFKFDRLGFQKLKYNDIDTFDDGFLDKIDIDKLYIFLNDFIGIIDYSYWFRDKIYEWRKKENNEAYRLFTVIGLYQDLKKYDFGKDIHYWKREVMDIGIIIEMLFTEAEDNRKIGEKLRKRVYGLIGDYIIDVKKEMDEIYELRSRFAHGSIFTDINDIYDIVVNKGEEDIKENFNFIFRFGEIEEERSIFKETEKYTLILRKLLLAYYLIFKKLEKGDYNSFFPSKMFSVIDVIRKGNEGNINIKKSFKEITKNLENILPY